MLELAWCRKRQERLVRWLAREGVHAAVIMSPKIVHYFSGALVDLALPQAFAIDEDGNSLLVTNREPRQAAADDIEIYTAYTIERVFSRRTMHEELVAAVTPGFGGQTVALEFDHGTFGLGWEIADDATDVTPELQRLRRHKDPDEIAAIRESIRITEAAYAAVKRQLAPGMTELEAYNIVVAAMSEAAGTSVTVNGDFASGPRGINGGGPPTTRRLEPGDLYILDLFPLCQGYMADLCRTFAVGEPTPLQRETWAHVIEGHDIALNVIRPGAKGCEVYAAIRDHLEAFPQFRGSFKHHAGHGLGMDGWEYPWLTPGSDQVIMEGEILACEPGLYGEALQGGIRLEHNYLVTSEGPVALDQFPMEL